MEEAIPGPPPHISRFQTLAIKLDTTPGGVITLFTIIGTLVILSTAGVIFTFLKRRKRKPQTPENSDVEKFNNGTDTIIIHSDASATSSPITPPADLPFLPSTVPFNTSSSQVSLHRMQSTASSSFKNRFRKLFTHTIPKALPSPKIHQNRSGDDSLTGIPWLMVSPRLSIFSDLDFNIFGPNTTPVLSGGTVNRRNIVIMPSVTPSPSLASNAISLRSHSFEAVASSNLNSSANKNSKEQPNNKAISTTSTKSPSTPAPASTPTPIPSIVLSNSESSINVIFDPQTSSVNKRTSRPHSSFMNFAGAGLGFGFSFKTLDDLEDVSAFGSSRDRSKRLSRMLTNTPVTPEVD